MDELNNTNMNTEFTNNMDTQSTAEVASTGTEDSTSYGKGYGVAFGLGALTVLVGYGIYRGVRWAINKAKAKAEEMAAEAEEAKEE